MPDSKAEERWFWHTYEANEKKLLNSQFSLSTIELDSSKEGKKILILIYHKTMEIPELELVISC